MKVAQDFTDFYRQRQQHQQETSQDLLVLTTVASVYSTPRFERAAEAIMGNEREPPKRPAILNKRVWASVRLDAKTLIGNAFEEGSKREPCASYREQRVRSPLGSVAVPR